MTLAIKVRLADTRDAANLARLRWEYRIQDHARQPRAEFLADCVVWLNTAFDSWRWVIAVASAGEDSLCGCLYLQLVEKVPIPGGISRTWGYITNAYVSPSYRGQGIGERMLELLTGTAKDRGLEFLIVWPSEEAVSFYERAGFRHARQVHDRPDDYPPLELEL